MKTRTSLKILFVLVLMSLGIVKSMSVFFSPEALMRGKPVAGASEDRSGPSFQEPTGNRFFDDDDAELAGDGTLALEQAPSLDDWYSSAGSSAGEPFDPSPEVDDFFINDAEPTTFLDEDNPEL